MRVMLYDSQDRLSPIWAAGQYIGNFGAVIPANSWDEAYEKLDALNKRINHLQIWGHGVVGSPVIAKEKIDLNAFKDALRKQTVATSVIWFRSCSVFAGEDGHEFAQDAVETLGCKVAAHTFIVSKPWFTHQSGGHGLLPGQNPDWSLNEGLDHEGKSLGSTPWKPNTCLVTDMMVPKKWWQN